MRLIAITLPCDTAAYGSLHKFLLYYFLGPISQKRPLYPPLQVHFRNALLIALREMGSSTHLPWPLQVVG
jgi:hypothetical protein